MKIWHIAAYFILFASSMVLVKHIGITATTGLLMFVGGLWLLWEDENETKQ